jgi:hypothetical protein
MSEPFTLVAGDVHYLSFYLKDKDVTTNSITYTNLSDTSSIVLRMRKYGASTNCIEVNCYTVTTPSNTLGFCRALVTIPAESGEYYSEIEVFYGDGQHATWKGNTYYIQPALG